MIPRKSGMTDLLVANGSTSCRTYRDVVFESAAFMASYAVWREREQRYVLGPPLIPAQEIHPPRETFSRATAGC